MGQQPAPGPGATRLVSRLGCAANADDRGSRPGDAPRPPRTRRVAPRRRWDRGPNRRSRTGPSSSGRPPRRDRLQPAISGAAAEVAHVLQEAPTGVVVAPHLEPAELLLGADDVQSGITQPGQGAHRRGGQVGQEVLRQGEGAQLLPQRGTERHLVGTLGDAGRTERAARAAPRAWCGPARYRRARPPRPAPAAAGCWRSRRPSTPRRRSPRPGTTGAGRPRPAAPPP